MTMTMMMVVVMCDCQKPTDELGRSYVAFMRVNMDQLRQKLTDELFILTMLEARATFTFTFSSVFFRCLLTLISPPLARYFIHTRCCEVFFYILVVKYCLDMIYDAQWHSQECVLGCTPEPPAYAADDMSNDLLLKTGRQAADLNST